MRFFFNNIDNYRLMVPYKPPVHPLTAIDTISNSTITQLFFDTANMVVSFVAHGPDGTHGFTEIVLSKALVSDPENLDLFR